MFKPITYTTPSATILPDQAATTGAEIWNGEDIARVLCVKVPCSFISCTIAPQIVIYHFNLSNVLELPKLKALLPGLAAALHAQVRQTESDKGHFALEVSRPERSTVYFKTALLTQTFNTAPGISTLLGLDTNNCTVTINIADMPHVLIAGATGSGKSVLLNDIITSLLFKHTPATLHMVMLDPKQVELSIYDGIPHLIKPVVRDTTKAVTVLADLCGLMDDRYKIMRKYGVKSSDTLELPPVVVIIDELADLMLTSKKAVETSIVRIAQLGRAAGVHLIVATQRPTVNVVTGLIKANIPCRIALQTASVRDSVVILDHKGAEALTGNGDGLLKLPDKVSPIRFQAAFIRSEDIAPVVEYWKGK